MATVRCWTGAHTKALRQAMRLSIRAFAAHLGVDARTVNKWEARGATITLLPDTQALMDTALSRAPEDVQTRFTQAVVSAESESAASALGQIAGEVAPLRQWGLLKHGIATVSFPALEFDELCHLGAAFGDARRYLDADVVGYFKRQLDSCSVNDGTHGPAQALPPVLGIVAAIEHHARQTKADVRRGLSALKPLNSWVGFIATPAGRVWLLTGETVPRSGLKKPAIGPCRATSCSGRVRLPGMSAMACAC